MILTDFICLNLTREAYNCAQWWVNIKFMMKNLKCILTTVLKMFSHFSGIVIRCSSHTSIYPSVCSYHLLPHKSENILSNKNKQMHSDRNYFLEQIYPSIYQSILIFCLITLYQKSISQLVFKTPFFVVSQELCYWKYVFLLDHQLLVNNSINILIWMNMVFLPYRKISSLNYISSQQCPFLYPFHSKNS